MNKLRYYLRNTFHINPLWGLLLLCLAGTIAVVILMEPRRIFHSVFPEYVFNEHEEEPPEEVIIEPEAAPQISYSEPAVPDGETNITYENIFSFKSFDIVRKNLYNIDRTAYVYDEELDFEKLLSIDSHVDLYAKAPKILIFHTHSQEAFSDSRTDRQEDTIVGVGDALAEILTKEYGIPVLHHKGVYDMVDGKEMRGGSYEAMEKGIRKVLEENPSIEIMIDLHRDSLPSNKRLLTNIDGRDTAQIMFFNGICRLNDNGEPLPTEGLENEYLEENLALSLKSKLLSNEMFPGFTRKNYIKPYRYSLHMRPNSLLIEVGSDTNTVSEAKNAMKPLAEILVKVFS